MVRSCDFCLAGGHFDNYIASYYHYKPGKIAEAFFQRPDICPEKPPDIVDSSPTSGWQHGLHAQILSILPNRYYGACPATRLLFCLCVALYFCGTFSGILFLCYLSFDPVTTCSTMR